jgi:predicted DNA-binding transcriptional regulator AlpA
MIPTTDRGWICIFSAGFREEPKEKPMATKHLNQIDLAARWNISHRTLERWRWTGEGPQYVKLGGRVVYRLEDVEEYEREQIRASTADHSKKLTV